MPYLVDERGVRSIGTKVIFNLLITFGLGLIDNALGLVAQDSGFGLLGGLYSLVVLIPGIAVGVRRLHDTGRSGWWLLIAFIPFIGVIALLVFMLSGSQPGKNQYD